MSLFLWLFFLFFCLPAETLEAAQPMQAGFRTLGIYEPDMPLRLDLAIWYPTKRIPAAPLDYGEWSFTASRNAPPEPGRHPLILLSHDSAGSRFSMYQVAISLAQSGFVVAAMTHAGDQLDNLDNIFTLAQLAGRAKDIRITLDILLHDQSLESMLDAGRVGLLGVGPGGAAALLLANARPDAAGWKNYCTQVTPAGENSQNNTLYCSEWAARRMAEMTADPDLSAKRRDSRIRAIAIVAPWYGMLFSDKALRQVNIPVLLINTARDTMNPPALHALAIRKALPVPPEYCELEANAAALLSPCTEQLARTWPEICFSVPEKIRMRVQNQLASAALHFFRKHLAGINPPPPPEPDEEELAAAKARAEAENTAKAAAEQSEKKKNNTRKKKK